MNRGDDGSDHQDAERDSAPAPSGPPGAAIDAQVLGRFGAQALSRLRAGFARSRHAMLIADGQRRWVTGNDAACELLGIGREEIPWRTMDDVTPSSGRRRLDEQWHAFLSGGAAEGWYHLDVPDRGPVPHEFSAIANVLEGRHLMVFVSPDNDAIARAQRGSARHMWTPVATAGSLRAQLTKRESEVMTLIATGGHSDDIATRLFLSSETIKSHAQNAMVKLGAHTRAHAVAIALMTGKIMWSDHDSPAGQANAGEST